MVRSGVASLMSAPPQVLDSCGFEHYGQPLTLPVVRCGYIESVNRRKRAEVPEFDDAVIDAAAVAHILDGDADYKGGHRYTSRVIGKTVFPETWSDEQIIAAVKAVVRRPTFLLWAPPHLILRSVVLGVIVEVALRRTRGRLIFKHAFPKSGVGVLRNETRRRVAVPLDLLDLER